MNKIIHGYVQHRPLLLFFLLLTTVSPYKLSAEIKHVKVGVFEASPMVVLGNGNPEGLFIDLVSYFQEELNWDVEYIEATWNDQLENLEKGDIDLLPAVSYTQERTLIYDFSEDPVYIDSGVLYTRPDYPLHTIFDLNNKKVAGLEGSIFTDGFIEYINSFGVHCEIIYTLDNVEVMKALIEKEVDAGISIYSLGNELMKQYPVDVTPISFSPRALHFAVPKGKNHELIEGIDSLMDTMISDSDSFYHRSFKKWTVAFPSETFPVWGLWVIFGLIFLGLFFILWTIVLRYQVRLKTASLNTEMKEHKDAKKVLKRSLEEKEVLLKELYHRTKNTMQVIRGMINLQAADYPQSPSIHALVDKTSERIQSISLVHEMLYKTENLSCISIREYIISITSLLVSSYGKESTIKVEYNIADLYFFIDTVIPFGLLLNELLTNSLQHAFIENKAGLISMTLCEKVNQRILFTYSDNGVGYKVEEVSSIPHLGTRLIHELGEMQLNGILKMESVNGTQYYLDFPINNDSSRI